MREAALFVRSEGAVALGVGIALEDMLVGRYQETGGAAGRV